MTLLAFLANENHIGGVMVSMLASSAVDCGFEPLYQVKQKTMKLVFVASLLKHAVLRRNSKDLLAQNQDNVFEWDDISLRRL
jgi:hypothetical protein